MYSKRFPKKITFFWNVSEQQLWPGRKNVIFSHKEDSQNIVVFSTRTSKKRRKFDPLGDGWDGMMRISTGGKEKHIRGKFPKKVVFWGFFEMETAQTWISQAIRNLEIIYIEYKYVFVFFCPPIIFNSDRILGNLEFWIERLAGIGPHGYPMYLCMKAKTHWPAPDCGLPLWTIRRQLDKVLKLPSTASYRIMILQYISSSQSQNNMLLMIHLMNVILVFKKKTPTVQIHGFFGGFPGWWPHGISSIRSSSKRLKSQQTPKKLLKTDHRCLKSNNLQFT